MSRTNNATTSTTPRQDDGDAAAPAGAAAAPTRRRLLGGVAALLPAAAVASVPALAAPDTNPDADLVAACAAFDALERRTIALHDEAAAHGVDPEDEAVDATTAAQQPFVEAICAARPVTMAGHRARAASLALFAPHLLDKEAHTDSRLVAAIVRDLAGDLENLRIGPVADQPAPRHDQDARILALAAEIEASDASSDALQDEAEAHPIGSAEREAVGERIYANSAHSAELVRFLHLFPAQTIPGLRAKARLVLREATETLDTPPREEGDSLMAWSLARDVIAGRVLS